MRKLKLEELGRKSIEAFKASPKLPVVVVLDNIRSALNVGSVFRTADAFAIESIILCGITARPPHREIQKTAIGATESVKWSYQEDIVKAVEQLENTGYTVYLVEHTDRARRLGSIEFKAGHKMAFVFGNEVEGVSQELIARHTSSLEIPQFGTKHSLNIAVSVGVVLWEVCRSVQDF